MDMLTVMSDVNATSIQENELNGGVQYMFTFKNGHEDRLWELAVLDSNNHIRYSTSVTDDVMGYLTEKMVVKTLQEIHDLKEKTK